MEAIKVVIRFRPVNKREKKEKVKIKCNMDISEDKKSIDVSTSEGFQRKFNFDRVFWYDTHQRDAYDFCCKQIVKDVMKGYNGTIFAYGQTGSGKTFTILGSENDKDLCNDKLMGFIPRVADDIFNVAEAGGGKDIRIKVAVQYCEIYLDKIFDLFSKQRKALRIRQSPTETYVQGLSSKPVHNVVQVIEYLKYGSANRFVRSTAMNAASSRSHSLFTIVLERQDKFSGTTTTGRFNLVDLAGSEKVEKTGAKGDMLEEAKKINGSLSALGNVINAIVEHKKHIPYRDSPLTRILKDALGGNSKTTIVCTASPHPFNIMETISTLRFGERAKKIKCRVAANVQLSPAQMRKKIEQLTKALSIESKKVKLLIAEIKNLKGEDFSKEYLNSILKTKKKPKKKVAGEGGGGEETKEEEEEEDDGEDVESKSFQELELREEIKSWKFKYDDKEDEIKAIKDENETKQKSLVQKLGKFKKVLAQVSNRLKKTESENNKLSSEMVLMKQEVSKFENQKESLILEWKEQIKFSEEDNEKLNEELEKLKNEKDELQGKLSLFQDAVGVGGGGGSSSSEESSETIKEMIDKKNKKIELLESEIEKKSQNFSKLKYITDSKIKLLNTNIKKRNEQCATLLKKLEQFSKEKALTKKLVFKVTNEKKFLLKAFVKEKEKLRTELMKENEKKFETFKKFYEDTVGSLKQEIEEFKKKENQNFNNHFTSTPVTTVVSSSNVENITNEIPVKTIYVTSPQKQNSSSSSNEQPQPPPVPQIIKQHILTESETIKKLKEIQKSKIQKLLLSFQQLKKVSDEKEKKLTSQNSKIFQFLKLKETNNQKLKTEYESLKNEKFEISEKLKASNKEWNEKFLVMFNKLKEMKTQFNSYKEKTKNENSSIQDSKIYQKFYLFVKLSLLKSKVVEKDKKIEGLQLDLIKAKKDIGGTAGSIVSLEKKFGNKLDILNELRGMRFHNQRVAKDAVRYKSEVMLQRKQLRENRIKIKKIAHEKLKIERQISELMEQIKSLSIKYQNKIDDRDRKIMKLEMDKEKLDVRVKEMERLQEIDGMFGDDEQNDFGGVEGSDRNDGFINPNSFKGKRRVIIKDSSDEEEDDSDEDEEENGEEEEEDSDDELLKMATKTAKGEGITLTIPSPSTPEKQKTVGFPKIGTGPQRPVSTRARRRRAGTVFCTPGGRPQIRRGVGGRPSFLLKRTELEKRKEKATDQINLDVAKKEVENNKVSPLKNTLSPKNNLLDITKRKQRFQRRRSQSFSVQRNTRIDSPVKAVNSKKFVNIASLKGADSPYGSVMLRKTKHGLW